MICKNLTHKLRMRATSMLGASLLAVAAVSLTGVAPSNAVFAQDEGRQFSAAAGEKVNEALTLANSGQNQAAVNILQNTISQPDLNAYERSTIYQMLGQYSYELDRAVEAQQNFENAINAGGLLPKEIDNILLVDSRSHNMWTFLSTLGYKPKIITARCHGLKSGLIQQVQKSVSILTF